MPDKNDPRPLTEAELLAMMDESDAAYEAGDFVVGEVVLARAQEALDRYAAEHHSDSPRTARRR